MRRAGVLSGVFGLAFSFAGWAAEMPQPDCSFAPGFKQVGEVRHYVPENLFDYMDGNAEGYIIYGFQRLIGVTCESADRRVVVDVFEMENPEMAYGVFCSTRDPRYPTVTLGMSAQITGQRATLVKGQYYVEVSASPGGDHAELLRGILARLVERLPGTTELPAPLGWFPREGLDEGSVRLVPQSVLGLRVLRRGYLARYDYGRAFLVREESAEQAAAVLEALVKRLGEAQRVDVGEEGYTGTDRYLGRMCVARKGTYVFGFAGLSGDRDGVAEARQLASRIP